jgi:MoxR-like ATPase
MSSTSSKPSGKSATDMELRDALFARKRSLDEFPFVTATTPHKTYARRNHHAGARDNSLLLVKSLLAALCGKVSAIYDTTTQVVVEALSPDRTTKTGAPSKTITAISQHGPLNPTSFFGSTYHIGLAALAEAVVRAGEAGDLLDAWKDLIEYTQSHHTLPLDWASLKTLNDLGFNEALLRCADELYFWTRYANAPDTECNADGPNDRVANAVINRSNPNIPVGSIKHANNKLIDPSQWTRVAPVTPALAPSSAPALGKGFKGPQKAILARAVEMRVPSFCFGPTAVGKTMCFEEVALETGWAIETVMGKESLVDLDFFGGLTKTKDGLMWVDGPLARAMRRAVKEPVLVFIDEFTRLQPNQANILIEVLNEIPEALLEKMGVNLPAASARGMYRRVEVPQCDTLFLCPAENLIIVLACNLGRAYNVNSVDPALLRRMKRKIEFRYLLAPDEIALLIERTPKLDLKVAKALVGVANQVRAMANTAEVSAPLDTDSLLFWAAEVAARAQLLAPFARTCAAYTTIAQEEARTTWFPAVLPLNLNGLMPDNPGLLGVIRDQFAANM